jgi:hypothetical protein
MAACPWCKEAVGDPLAPCPKCGRRSDEQVPLTGALDVPDLDLPVRGPKAPAGASSKAIPGARTLDDDDSGVEGGPLELDMATAPAAAAAAKVAAATAAAAAAASPTAQALTKGGKTSEEENSLREARALAAYGDPPEMWFKTPLYAYRVLRRRSELKKIATAKQKEAERADAAAEDALVAFAEIVRPTAERYGGSYEAAFEAVRQTERVLGERDAILAAETDAHNQRKAEIDAKLTGQEAQLTQIQIEERQVAGELAEAEALLKRAEARARNTEIEMRNAMAQAQQGEGDASPPSKGSGA